MREFRREISPRQISEIAAKARKEHWARKEADEIRLRTLYGPE